MAAGDVSPAGLGCRDTLRLEMGMALYGNDIDDTVTPLEANLAWLVKLKKGEFVGSPVLNDQKANGVAKKLVGFTMTDRNIARHGYPVFANGAAEWDRVQRLDEPDSRRSDRHGVCPDGTVRRRKRHSRSRSAASALPATVVKPPFYKDASHSGGSMRVAILTISDAGVRGERADTSGRRGRRRGPVERGYVVAQRALVSDDTGPIAATLAAWCDADVADLVLTTGGTGLSVRDVTPEATRAVIERDAPGIAERIRVLAVANFPRAALSRGLSGIRKRTLIVNLPGSTGGVRDGLAALDPIIDHAIAVLRGDRLDHADPATESTVPSAAQ